MERGGRTSLVWGVANRRPGAGGTGLFSMPIPHLLRGGNARERSRWTPGAAWRTITAMANEPSELPTGDGPHREPTASDEDRPMRSIRDARVRAMIARGETPFGYRVSDDGKSFVRLGNPAWPVRPLDPHCHQYGEPALELLALIRNVLPDFDPERDARGWREVAEVVRRTGRPAPEVESMGHDELVAFFRHEVFDRRRSPAEVEQTAPALAKPAPSATAITPNATSARNTKREKTTRELLLEWLGDPEKKTKLVATKSADRAGELIGRSGSSVREAGEAWKKLKTEFATYRTFRRFEKHRNR